MLLKQNGAAALGLSGALAARLTVELTRDGKPTGWLAGDNRSISDLFNLLPRPSFAQKLAGTRAFFRVLNAMGITGVSDPGGYNIEIADYQPLYQLWREGGLTLRVRYSLSAPRRDREDFKELTQLLPMGAGDDWLRFNGIGETVSGVAMRAPEELPTRIDALRLYTHGSAWFSFEENTRGALKVGHLADLAVLDRDYLSVPVGEIGGTASLLTMAGGRIVYTDGPYAALEEKPR